MKHMNKLVHEPEFYHALIMNCTSVITLHTKVIAPDIPVTDWRLLANGHMDELLYDHGSIRSDLPFVEVRRLSRVDQRMQAQQAADFSARLREGLASTVTST